MDEVSPIAMINSDPISSLSLTLDNITNKHTNINDAWNLFKCYLISIFDIHAPMIKNIVRGRDYSWLTPPSRP